ncbi:cupin domain-containing protein [Cupriavidus pauculus]|uniref:cupin domain-containing protein n=1 Tax=Cupriavidus pauculus TaxID=82633 RepID=UPI001EE2F2FA|nr:cupin domain-containing protein [Cupriavidus pauculus]GJG95488.1 cupin domain-containing protein [Cupriavidus pauculus]
MTVTQGNLLHNVPVHADGEVFTDLVTWPASGRARVERIVSNGQASPPGFWYDSADDEWVLVITGSAAVETDDGTSYTLGAGDWLHLPAHCRHRVAWTDAAQATVWLAVHATPAA